MPDVYRVEIFTITFQHADNKSDSKAVNEGNMVVTITSVGNVDKEALEKLYNNFDTRRVLDTIGDIDYLIGTLEEPGGPRRDFFRLHEMVMHLIDDDSPPADGEPIWELVEDLSSTMYECQERLERVIEVLNELEALTPDPDDDFEDPEEPDE